MKKKRGHYKVTEGTRKEEVILTGVSDTPSPLFKKKQKRKEKMDGSSVW